MEQSHVAYRVFGAQVRRAIQAALSPQLWSRLDPRFVEQVRVQLQAALDEADEAQPVTTTFTLRVQDGTNAPSQRQDAS